MKFLYVPLDERPCNRLYPQQIARLQPDVSLVAPPIELLGQKKQAASVAQLWDWIMAETTHSATPYHAAILSIEMLVYGGLLPSRLHHHTVEELSDRLYRFRQLKAQNPQLPLFASNLIMRTPAYDSSEEEPDYYADWGQAIFQWGWYQDKQQRHGLTTTEMADFDRITQALPPDSLRDYQARRAKNLTVNQGAIALVRENVLEFLSIPQDDSAPYGFTAMDQRQLVSQIIGDRLQHRIHLYPGADEVGCTLLTRAYTRITQSRPLIYVCYSSVHSQSIIPLYEDRPLGESVKSHILAVGGGMALTPNEADVILAVNTPGQMMQEAWDQVTKDVTYTTDRNLRFFVDQIYQYGQAGKQVAIADVAFANGGETELVQLLDDAQLWDDLLAYAGWNTCCNTLGTVIAAAVVGMDGGDRCQIQHNNIYHLLEDWAYQAIVRRDVVNQYLPKIDVSYYDFNDKEPEILAEIERRLRHIWNSTLRHSFQRYTLDRVKVYSPWHRMFEIGIDLSVSHLAE